jgi:hypothetical protein
MRKEPSKPPRHHTPRRLEPVRGHNNTRDKNLTGGKGSAMTTTPQIKPETTFAAYANKQITLTALFITARAIIHTLDLVRLTDGRTMYAEEIRTDKNFSSLEPSDRPAQGHAWLALIDPRDVPQSAQTSRQTLARCIAVVDNGFQHGGYWSLTRTLYPAANVTLEPCAWNDQQTQN